MPPRRTIELTAHFEHNLDEIERFLAEADTPQSFDALLTELTDTVLPNLQRFPAMGRDFLQRPRNSVEVANGAEKLGEQLKNLDLNGELREYVLSEYLLLYALIKDTVFLLSIRHHKQLSFDFQALWPTAT